MLTPTTAEWIIPSYWATITSSVSFCSSEDQASNNFTLDDGRLVTTLACGRDIPLSDRTWNIDIELLRVCSDKEEDVKCLR